MGELGSTSKTEGEEDGVGTAVGKVSSEVHVLVGEMGPGLGGTGGSVGFFLVNEFHAELFTTNLLGVFGLLSGADEVKVFVLLGERLGPWILDDGGVWELGVGDETDLSRGRTVIFQVGGGDGELDGLSLLALSNDPHWEFDGNVAFESDLVVALGVWNLGGETGLELTDGTHVNFSMDSGLASLSLDSDLSNSGNNDGHVHSERDWESEDGGDLPDLFPRLDGLLEGDFFNLLVQRVAVELIHPDVDHSSDFGSLDEGLEVIGGQFGGDEHLVPDGEGGVNVVLLPDVVGLGLHGEGDGEWGKFQRIRSQFPGALGEELEVFVGSVGLEEGEASEELDLGLLSNFLSVIQVLGDSFSGRSTTEGLDLGLDLGSDVLHASVVIGNGFHLGHGLDGGSDKGLELNVGRDGGGGDLGPVLVGGVFAGEDQRSSGHSHGRWQRAGLNVGHEVGDDRVSDESAGHGVISIGGLDQSLVGEDSLGSDEGGFGILADDVFQVLDDFWESQDTDSGQEDCLLFGAATIHDSGPQLLIDKVVNFSLGEVGSAERAGNLDGEFSFGDARVDTSLVSQRSERQESNLSINLINAKGLDSLLEHLDESPGWESGVSWHGQQVVNLLDGVNLAGADELVADGQSG